MELSLILLQKIITLLLIVGMGFLSVKSGKLRSEQSSVLSRVCFDWAVPCSIINSFMTTQADDVMSTFLFLCVVTACLILTFVGVTFLIRRFVDLNPSEQGSLMFTNSATMALPMTQALLGSEYVIFCAPHMGLQNFLLFSLVPWLMNGKAEGGWRKVLLNRNIVSIFIGLFLFVTKVQLPSMLTDTISMVGSSNAVFSMLMIGMLMGGVNFRELLANHKVYLVAGIRLIAYPLLAILLIRITGIAQIFPSASGALMVLVMCVSSPVANIVTQMSSLYRSHQEAQESGSINVMTTMLCCITMPIMIFIYQMVCL